MKIDLQKSLENVRKQMGVYTPTAADAGKIDLNKSLETVRALQKQQQAQTASDRLKARKLAKSPLETRAAETLRGLQEGSELPKLHPTGGPLQVSQDTLRDFGMVNENGFVLGGVDPAQLGLTGEDMAKLLGTPSQSPAATALPKGEPSADAKWWEKDYIGYVAGEFGAGMLSSPTGVLGGAVTGLGDLATGGKASEGAQVLANYFAQKPQMLQRWMTNEMGVEQMILNETGVTPAALAAYRTANTDDWIRQSLQQDRGANLEQGFKDAVGDIAYTIGQQVPGMVYSMGAPASDGGGILSSVAGAIKNKSGVGQALASSAKSALKGNVNTWLLGGGAAGNQLTELAKQKGYDPVNYINAMGNGFVEYINEGLFGFSDGDSIKALWRATGSKTGNTLKSVARWLMSSAEEGLEEVVNVPMSGIVDKMTTEPDKKLLGEGGIFDFKEMLNAGIQGAVVGLIMGGVGGVSSIRNAVLEGADIHDAATAMNHLIAAMPTDMRPAQIDPKTATAETLADKQAEVLAAYKRMEEAAGTASTTPSARSTFPAQAGKALEQEPTQSGFEQGQNQAVQSFEQAAPQIQTAPVQNDAQRVNINQEVLNNGQTEILSGRGPQRGSAEINAGGAGQVERTGTAAPAGRSQSAVAQQRTRLAEQHQLTTVSSRELGLSSGTDVRRNVILDNESLWDDELRSIKQHWDEMNRTRREKYGYKADVKLQFVLGQMETVDYNGQRVLVEGFTTDDGTVCVCVNKMTRTATEIAEHEEFHALVGDTPELVEALWPVVEGEGLNDAMVERYRQFYGETLGYSDQMVREEILADAYAGLERIQGTGMRTIRDYVKQLTGEAQEAIDQGWYTPEAADEYENVDSEGRETRGPPMYSIETLEDGRKYVRADRQVIFGNDPEVWGEQVEDYINGKIRRGEDVQLTTEDGDVLTLTAETAGKAKHRYNPDGSRMSDALYETKLNAETHIDELAGISRRGKTVRDYGERHGEFAKEGWNYRTAFFMDFDEVYYEVTISVAQGAGGNVVYNVGNIHRRSDPTINGSSAKRGAQGGNASSEDSVPQGELVVKERFSLSEPVEQTETLIALHNMDEEKLRRTLDLGAWPAPSIAIVQAEQGHTTFGDYSAIFPRSTIDPEADSRNRVYGSDAWTPTHNNAQTEYEVNYDARRAADDLIWELSKQFADGAFTHSSVIGGILPDDATTKDLDSVARQAAKQPSTWAAYLQDRGETLTPTYKEKIFDSFGNEALQTFVEGVGFQELARLDMEILLNHELDADAMKWARDVIMDHWIEKNQWRLNQKPELREKRIANQRSRLEDYRVRQFIENAWEYYEHYGESSDVVDKDATSAAMMEMIAPDGSWDDVERTVRDWLRPKLEGVIGEAGIYNGVDRITDNGRRSFKQTHYPLTAENIVRAMYQQGTTRGEGASASAEGLASVATPEYESVESIHADEGRLRTEDEAAYRELMNELQGEIDDFVLGTMEATEAHSSNRYEEESIIEYVLMQAAGQRDAKGVQRVFRKEGYNLPTELAQAAVDLFNKAAATPTKYFEAKPERVVGFDEALALVAPDNAPEELMRRARDAGMNVITYTADDNASRIEAVNSVQGARFSVADEQDGEYAPTFYSHMERVIEATKQEKLGAASVVSMLKGKGVKNEEIKWSGIETFLEGKKSVTKQELLEFARGNQLQIEETEQGETVRYTPEQQAELDDLSARVEELLEQAADLWERCFDEEMPLDFITSGRKTDRVDRRMFTKNNYSDDAKALRQIAKKIEINEYWIEGIANDAKADGAAARWKEYKMDGGENYREYLFKLPGSDYSNQAMQAHWGNQTGVLAHARVQDFEHNGEPVLFIEEIQSDWHNAGVKSGYASEVQQMAEELQELERRQAELEEARRVNSQAHNDFLDRYWASDLSEEEYDREMERYWPEDRRLMAEEQETAREINDRRARVNSAAPDAPFSKNYHEFVLKNLLRKAAEGDYAYLAWTPGWMQEERWSSEFAEGYRIEYDQDIPKFLNKYGKQWGAKVEDIELDGLRNMSVHAIPVTESMRRSVLYGGQPMYSVATEETAEEPQRRDLTPGQELTRKEQSVIKRAINSSKMQLRDIIPAGTKEARETQQMQMLGLARKLWETGEITQEDIDDAFEAIWDAGEVVDRELADQYAELRADLKAGVTVSAELKKNITDFESFRRANFGIMTMRNGEAQDIDDRYRDWTRDYPNFFPESIKEPADQLERAAEIAQKLRPTKKTMDELYKGDWNTKAGMKVDFVDLVRNMELEILHPVQEITAKTANQKEAERVASYRQIYNEVMEEVFKVKQRETYEPNPEYWHEVADDAWNRMNERAAAIQSEWLRSLTKEGFKGTESLDALGVKIAGSVADYHLIGQILENHRAAQAVRRDIRKAERKLKATPAEKQLAAGIVSGVFDESNISGDARPHVVMELADYYMMERIVGLDMIQQRRNDMYADVDYQVETLMRDKEAYKISSSPVLFYRTPQRNMINLYGREQGQKVYDFLFAPVAENEAERLRWTNRMYETVREIEGSDGKKKALNRKERALVQMVMEGRAAAEVVAAMEERQVIYDAADNLRNGQDIDDVVRTFNLTAELRDAASDYATWLDTNDILETTKGVDLQRIYNAADIYAEQYNKFYAAINDFLAAHGYEPIGFIKGYAPHIQPEQNRNMLQKALNAMGLSDEVSTLPTAIAGQTHVYRPNKRWNPHFLSRHGEATEYDVAAGYENYVDYLSDILFHTDDTVRIRRAANYFRRTYAPEEISNNLSWAEGLRNASPEQKAEMLRENGKLRYDEAPSAAAINDLFDSFVQEQYDNLKSQGKYSNFVNWLEDYANQLTGKQSLADRGMEVLTGRQSLNFANKLNRAFQQANVAGNVSTALNQTAQLPQIVADNGLLNTTRAMLDYAKGIVRRDGFREKSDFLTAKAGVNNLVIEPTERVINALFTPAQIADDMMSYVAVRGAYIKAVRQGMDDAAAMRFADRKGEQIMGSRAKGSAPQAFRSRNPVVRMVNMFQVEALNSFEYVEQDLIIQGIKDIKQIDSAQGRVKATAALIGLLGKMLVAAFLWNRATEELYGGSPAQFDLLGYAANFLASGNGLTANTQLLDWIDMAWERAFGEPLFDIDPEYNEEFDWENAVGDLGYAVGSDVPLVRNVMGLLGLGDQSLPMPDLSTVGDAAETLWSSGASLETLDAVLTAAGQFVPGGRQINKTYQGARAIAKGGRYYGYGENERLQYPVDVDFSNSVKALLFGPSGLSENAEFYAAGGNGLSAKQTQNYQELMMAGLSSDMALEAYREYQRLNRDETLTAQEKATEMAKWTADNGLTEEQAALAREAFTFFNIVPAEATRYDSFTAEGLDANDAYALTEALDALEPEEGETRVSNLQRYRAVLDHMTDEAMRYAALAGVMQDKEFARFSAAYEFTSADAYVGFLEAFEETYPDESKSQERVESVLKRMSLTNVERAAIWQACNTSWKPKNNPFSENVGREVSEIITEKYAALTRSE